MQVKTVHSFHLEHMFLYERILYLTQEVSKYYPDYEQWYWGKFIPGLLSGERSYILAEEKGVLAGCVLMKKTQKEKKICTFFVHPDFRRKGLGRKLFQKAFLELGKSPILSVTEKTLPQFMPLLKEFNFKPPKIINNKYGKEYFFNLPSKRKIKRKDISRIKNAKVKQI